MDLIRSFILGIVQGLTEFLPVSSSGHLALLQNYFEEIDIAFDVMLHFATLLAVVCFFFRDIINLIKGFFSFSWQNENFRMCIYLIIATLPAGFIGYFFNGFIENSFSNLFIIACGFFISAMFLFTASFAKSGKEINFWRSLWIGVSQALAIFPGISRSGSTSATGILLGLSREKAIRFSFLLFIPAILGASLLKFDEIVNLDYFNIFVGFLSSFVFGLFAIFLFVKHISLKNFRWFALYCFILGILSLMMFFKVI